MRAKQRERERERERRVKHTKMESRILKLTQRERDQGELNTHGESGRIKHTQRKREEGKRKGRTNIKCQIREDYKQTSLATSFPLKVAGYSKAFFGINRLAYC